MDAAHSPRAFQSTAMTFARFTPEPARPATPPVAAQPSAVVALVPSGLIILKRQT